MGDGPQGRVLSRHDGVRTERQYPPLGAGGSGTAVHYAGVVPRREAELMWAPDTEVRWPRPCKLSRNGITVDLGMRTVEYEGKKVAFAAYIERNKKFEAFCIL